MVELVTVGFFFAAALTVLAAPVWMVAAVLLAHAGWDVVHLRWKITRHVGDYPAWCAAVDVAAASVLLVIHGL